MKSVVICCNKMQNISIETQSRFFLKDVSIPVGLVESEEPRYDLQGEYSEYVLVKKHAFSCNYRDKRVVLELLNALNRNSLDGKSYYSPVGSEFVGTIVDVGIRVRGFNKGDRVIPIAQYPEKLHPGVKAGIPSNFASKRYQIFHYSLLLKIPDEIPDPVAASLTIAGHTVYSMIEKARLQGGEHVLITSLKSNTSLAIASALKNKGVCIWGLTSSLGFFERFKDAGVTNIIAFDNRVSDLMEVEEVRAFVETHGGFDVVFDPYADLHIGKLTSCMNVDSRYITCGFFDQFDMKQSGKFTYTGKQTSELLSDCIFKNITIMGNCLGSKRHLELAVSEFLKGDFNIPIDSVIAGDNVAYFFDRSFNDRNRFGKVVYQYTD